MISYLKNYQDKLLVAIIILTSFSIYLPTIKIPLINDEIAFIQRNEISSVKDSPTLFEKKDYDDNYYRPLPDFVSGLTTLVFKYNYFYYRIFNICLHTISGVLIYYFLLSLPFYNTRKKFIALFSALFFITFPLHDYSVIWHTDLFDRIMLIFYIAGLLAFIKNNLKPGFFSVAFFSLALLSKEMAFSFPLIIGLTYFCFNKNKSSIKEGFYTILPYLVVAVLFILLRIIIFGNNIFTEKGAHSAGTLLDVLRNYILFCGLLIFPFSLREIQTYILAHHVIAILLGSSFVLLMIFFIWHRVKKDYVLIFFILFILLTIAPASRLLMRWYLYLPSVGFTSALAYLIFTLKFNKISLQIALAVIILFVYSSTLISKENKWIKDSSESLTALTNFIGTYKNEILKNGEVAFLTIPAEVDDIPVFQLGFDKLFNFYLHGNKTVHVEVLTKSFIFNFSDPISTSFDKDAISIKQIGDNYFILFNNEENVKFETMLYKKGKLCALTINYHEVNNKILYTFSNGEFYKTRGIR